MSTSSELQKRIDIFAKMSPGTLNYQVLKFALGVELSRHLKVTDLPETIGGFRLDCLGLLTAHVIELFAPPHVLKGSIKVGDLQVPVLLLTEMLKRNGDKFLQETGQRNADKLAPKRLGEEK